MVFDGWRTGSTLEQHEHRSGIDVVYSRRGERADQVIQRLARDYGTSCAVVSSDHEVVDSARLAGAFVISATEFWSRLSYPHPTETCNGSKNLIQKEMGPSAREPRKKAIRVNFPSLNGNGVNSLRDSKEPARIFGRQPIDLVEI